MYGSSNQGHALSVAAGLYGSVATQSAPVLLLCICQCPLFFVYTSVGLYGAVAVMLTCTAAICGCALYLCAAVPCAV